MRRETKKKWWIIAVPVGSILHFLVSVMLVLQLHFWLDLNAAPPAPWVITLVKTIFFLMMPLVYLGKSLSGRGIPMWEIFSLSSYLLSPVLWWSFIVWLITTERIKRRRQRILVNDED